MGLANMTEMAHGLIHARAHGHLPRRIKTGYAIDDVSERSPFRPYLPEEKQQRYYYGVL
uniref:Uncharacterized protein n=1 Tax=Oryza sativa subsp. japonica TaxID=39947 RepID=Q69XK8_ORYSJ|nr:hypothetical protein [Oryza sativa Japonica Group]BAD35449.1 hypothetical protein [Oryza sativa Japonica Group]